MSKQIVQTTERTKALEVAFAQIDKQFGKGSVMLLGQKTDLKLETISTGSILIDQALGVGGLPFVIAETGMTGPNESHPRALSLMKAQAAVAGYPEFKGNVAFVGTKAFWREKEDSPSGQGYHWNTNAETYYLIGEAMGQAMKGLCNKCVRHTEADSWPPTLSERS